MPATTITVQELTKRNEFATPAEFTGITAAVDATNGALVPFGERDDKYLILIQNVNSSAAKSVTIKGGDSFQAGGDLTLEIPKSEYVLFPFDSGRFLNTTGTNKGKIHITGASVDIQVAVFKLP